MFLSFFLLNNRVLGMFRGFRRSFVIFDLLPVFPFFFMPVPNKDVAQLRQLACHLTTAI